MRATLQPAFVLHAKPFRDTSLLVELLTLNHGRIHVLARSARGLRSRFKGMLQPFIPFLASWSGNTDLMYLSVVEPSGAPYQLAGMALICGIYLNELLVRLLHREDSHPDIYLAYQSALIGLQQGEPPEVVLRIFEKRLLMELGYAVQLHEDASGEPISAEQLYRCMPERGFVKTHTQDTDTFFGKHLLALHHETLTEEDWRAAKRLLRLLLMPLLGDKPIRSRELF